MEHKDNNKNGEFLDATLSFLEAIFSDGDSCYASNVNIALQDVAALGDEMWIIVNGREAWNFSLNDPCYSTRPDRVMRFVFQPLPTPNPVYAWKSERSLMMSNLKLSDRSWLFCNCTSWSFHQANQAPAYHPIFTFDQVDFHCCSISPVLSEYTFTNYISLVMCNGLFVQDAQSLQFGKCKKDTIESFLLPSPAFSCTRGRLQQTAPSMMEGRFLRNDSHGLQTTTFRLFRQYSIALIAIVVLVMAIIIVVALLLWWRRFQRHRLYQQLSPDNHDLMLTVEEDYYSQSKTLPRSSIQGVINETE